MRWSARCSRTWTRSGTWRRVSTRRATRGCARRSSPVMSQPPPQRFHDRPRRVSSLGPCRDAKSPHGARVHARWRQRERSTRRSNEQCRKKTGRAGSAKCSSGASSARRRRRRPPRCSTLHARCGLRRGRGWGHPCLPAPCAHTPVRAWRRRVSVSTRYGAARQCVSGRARRKTAQLSAGRSRWRRRRGGPCRATPCTRVRNTELPSCLLTNQNHCCDWTGARRRRSVFTK